jgi:hypothetical protein
VNKFSFFSTSSNHPPRLALLFDEIELVVLFEVNEMEKKEEEKDKMAIMFMTCNMTSS